MDFENGQITYALRCWIADPRRVGAIRSIMWQHLYALFQRQGWYLSAPNKDLSIIAMRHKKEAQSATQHHTKAQKIDFLRSEERRVGKEWSTREEKTQCKRHK